MNHDVLTVAIPTYERRATVLRSFELHLAALETLRARVLVADNASTDGTVAALREVLSARPGSLGGRHVSGEQRPALEVIAGEANTGILGNFRRLVDACTTDYLLLLSDEESPVGPDAYRRLIERLEQERPDALVPFPGRGIAGRPRRGPIAPTDVWDATMYLSGCLYRTEALRGSVARIERIASDGALDGIWRLWPFYLVTLDLSVHRSDVRWHPEALYVPREHLVTTIEDPLFPTVPAAGPPRPPTDPAVPDAHDPAEVHRASTATDVARRSRYKSLDARLTQAAALATYLQRVVKEGGEPTGSRPARVDRRVVAALERDLERRLHRTIVRRISHEHPPLADAIAHRHAGRGVGGRAVAALRRAVRTARARWRRSG
jgi:hypothetical protein